MRGLYKAKSGVYYYRFKHEGREYRLSTGCRDRKEAERAARKLRTKVEEGEHRHRQRRREGGLTMATVAALDIDSLRSHKRGARKRARRVTPEHISSTESKWEVTLRNLPDGPDTLVADLNLEAIEEYASRRMGIVKAQTFKRELMLIKRGLRLAASLGAVSRSQVDEMIDDWPLFDDDPKDEGRSGKYWAPAEVHAFIQALKPDAADEMAFCYYTGLRWKEMKKARHTWVFPLAEGSEVPAVLRLPGEYRTADGERQHATKGKKPREVPLLPEVVGLIRRRVASPYRCGRGAKCRQGCANDLELIFSRHNYRKHRDSVGAQLRASGLLTRGYTPTLRDMRSTCATELGNRGVNPRIIQAILGHTSLEMTQRYWQVTTNKLAEGGAALAGLLAPRDLDTEGGD